MMVQPKPYQWRGGMFHEFPPLSRGETDQLCLSLGVSLSERAIITKSINTAFLQLFERVSRQFNGISHARGEKQAKKLLFLENPASDTDDYFAAAQLAKWLGCSLDQLGSHVRTARLSLINSSSDFRENRPLSNFCCHIIYCADAVLPEWTLPTSENFSDETFQLPETGVMAFAQLALALGSKRLREGIPKAHKIISDLELTSPRSLRDTIAKWCHETLATAFEKRTKTASLRKNRK